MSSMLKHIKSYQLFESLKDEYDAKLIEIDIQRSSALNNIKKQVDEYMNYILDEYQKDNRGDYIDESIFQIWYKNISCKLNPSNWSECDKFIHSLENIFSKIEDEFEVTVEMRGSFLYSYGHRGKIHSGEHDIENGHVVDIDKVKNYIDRVKKTTKGEIPDYHTFNVEICIS